MYGRGYSDAPNVPYTAGLYTTQLALLMQHVKWERAHVTGLSMVSVLKCCLFTLSSEGIETKGGGIATAFAASFPDLVTGKVVLIASTGLMEVRSILFRLSLI